MAIFQSRAARAASTAASVAVPTQNGAVTVAAAGAPLDAFAASFVAALGKPASFVDLSTAHTYSGTGTGPVLNDATAGGTVTLPGTGTSPHYFFSDTSASVSVIGSGHNDSVLAGGPLVYYDHGGDNVVSLTSGNGAYVGDTATGAGADTIYAGSGVDWVNTGHAAATVDSGTGTLILALNDTVAAGDIAYLNGAAGTGAVAADGARDKVVIGGGGGQIVTAGSSTTSTVSVVISAGTADTINGGGAHTTLAVFDGAGGNSITGGQGALSLIASAAVADTVSLGSGGGSIFGAAGSDFTVLDSAAGAGALTFLAGAGNETLNGAGASAALDLFAGNAASTASAATSQLLVGGAGNDYLFSGTGSETLTGGGGTNTFIIGAPADSVAAHVLISDFGSGSNDVAAFSGYTPVQVQAALDTLTHVSGSFGSGVEITFTDGTTVIFAGVNTLNGHLVNL